MTSDYQIVLCSPRRSVRARPAAVEGGGGLRPGGGGQWGSGGQDVAADPDGQQRRPGGGGRGVVVLGRRGQLQPSGAAPARQINNKKAEKAAIENRTAAGDEETDDISRHRHAVVGRDQRQPGHQGIGGKWGQWQEDQSLGEMLKELRGGSHKYENYEGGGTIRARYIGPVNLL